MRKKGFVLILMTAVLVSAAWIQYKKSFQIETAADLAPVISAKGAILIDVADGRVIYEKSAEEKLAPASTTKIMTALVALEIMEEIDADLNSRIKIPKAAVGIEGSSLYLKENEDVSVEELLYGMMLQSGNDAATATALSLGGSTEAFVERMNDRAREIGCKNTHFTGPSGLYDENHYTTAADLAMIAREAMKNRTFRKIVAAEDWHSKDTGRTFSNKNKTIFQYDGATGIKIGYTKASGRTLAASAKRGDRELIAVVLDDPNWFKDAYALLDYGFMREE